MSIILELISPVLIAVLFEFIFYITGTVILRGITLGAKNFPVLSFSEFKSVKQLSTKKHTLATVTGLLFYVIVISATIALG